MDVLDRADLPFPHSLPEFQRFFPNDAACAAYLEKARWGDGYDMPQLALDRIGSPVPGEILLSLQITLIS